MKRRKIIFRGKDYLIELYETFHSLPILHPLSLKKVTKLEDNERASRISRHGSSKKITKLQIFYKLDETREKSKLISSDWHSRLGQIATWFKYYLSLPFLLTGSFRTNFKKNKWINRKFFHSRKRKTEGREERKINSLLFFPNFLKNFSLEIKKRHKGWNGNVISIGSYLADFLNGEKIGVDVKLTGTMEREHQDIATTRQPSL